MIPFAVGIGKFRSYGNKPYSTLKPGQCGLTRTYYNFSTRNVPDGKGYTSNFSRFDSNYGENHNKNVKPDDYKGYKTATNLLEGYDNAHEPRYQAFSAMGNKRTSSMTQPDLKVDSGLLNAKASILHQRSPLYKTTSHWRSSYNKSNDLAQTQHLLQAQRPEWSYPRTAYSSTRSNFYTEHEKRFGNYRDNPRDLLPSTATALPSPKEENLIGTTKMTSNIPGYTGFIPISDVNRVAVSQANVARPRTTYLKNNIVENYSRRIPGFAGHLPASAKNDKGHLRPFCLSTEGEAFY